MLTVLLLACAPATPTADTGGCGFRDDDGDGFGVTMDSTLCESVQPEDCDDHEASVHPYADETCNGTDDDCDGVADEEVQVTLYVDADGDDAGAPETAYTGCDGEGPTRGDDCDDADAGVYPGAVESCDGRDQDCDGAIDEDLLMFTWNVDADGDGYGDPAQPATACTQPAGTVEDATDCDDSDASVYPGAPEVETDGIDSDCDGAHESVDLRHARTRVIGADTGDGFGIGIAAGDTDGDGATDLLTGALYRSDEAGAAYLLRGPLPEGEVAGDSDVSFFGDAAGDYLGLAVALVDLDGDGTGEALISAFDAGDDDAGAVYLFADPLPPGNVPLAEATATWRGPDAYDDLGVSLASAGDTDGDGLDEALFGDWYADLGAISGGVTYLVSGLARGERDLAVDARAVLIGEATSDFAGRPANGAGDVDGDGLDDVMVGAHGNDRGGSYAGAAYLVLGPMSGRIDLADADATFLGEVPGGRAGWSATGAGDTDADGYADVFVGAPDAHPGRGYVVRGPVYGAMTLAAADAVLTGEGTSTLGEYGLGGHDLDSDGADDLVVGDWHADHDTSEDVGAAYVFRGPIRGALGPTDAGFTALGADADDYAGYGLAVADMDGDGREEVLVGANMADTGGTDRGGVFVFVPNW